MSCLSYHYDTHQLSCDQSSRFIASNWVLPLARSISLRRSHAATFKDISFVTSQRYENLSSPKAANLREARQEALHLKSRFINTNALNRKRMIAQGYCIALRKALPFINVELHCKLQAAGDARYAQGSIELSKNKRA